MTALYIIFIIAAAAILCYSVLCVLLMAGWTWKQRPSQTLRPDVAIVLAYRNEEDTIAANLLSLLRLQYSGKYRIVAVNDHSTDRSVQRLAVPGSEKITFLHLPEGQQGKRAAIAAGIAACTERYIAVTDADCVVPPQWLEEMMDAFQPGGIVLGPVACRGRGFFSSLQELELCGLMLVTGGSAALRMPMLANGANMLFCRELYESLPAGESGTGDDIALLRRALKEQKEVVFCRRRGALVTTTAEKDLGSFMRQRIRWASKNTAELGALAWLGGAAVWLANLLSLALLCISPVMAMLGNGKAALYSLILPAIKCFIDFLLLFLAASFFGRRTLLMFFLPAQALQLVYVSIAGLWSRTGRYEWKGRKVSR